MKSCFYAVLILLCPAHLGAQIPLDSLPQLGDYESQRASSYDRSGGNADYRSLKPGETIEIFNEDGPGEIRHIWTTLPPWSEAYHLKKVVLRMYWDSALLVMDGTPATSTATTSRKLARTHAGSTSPAKPITSSSMP